MSILHFAATDRLHYPPGPTLAFRSTHSARLRWLLTAASLLCLAATGAHAAEVALSWQDNSTNETGFKVERATGAGAYAVITTTSGNTATYVDTTVAASTTYNYRVVAFNSVGNSPYSNVASAIIPAVASNTAPTITNIANRAIASGSNTGAVAFTVGDAQTAAASLTVSGSSSNTTLLPNAAITFGGSGANRTVTATPVANQAGTATVTVTVSDGTLTAADPFTLTVTAANTAPTISNISDRTITQGTNTGAIAFTVGDSQTAAASLTLSGSSSNTTLAPNATIVFGGSGANRTVTVTPAASRTGSATITITVSDGTLTRNDTFALSVNPVAPANQPPTITTIPNQSGNAGGPVGPVTFTVADNETAAASLTITATSSNAAVVPPSGIVLAGSGATRSVTVTPAAGQTGSATITVTVSDGTNVTGATFIVTINAVPVAGARLLNLSSRVVCRPSQESLIPGFVISGTANQRVLLRAVGPTLGAAPYNVPGVLPDPRITLKRWNGTTFVDHATNDNWGTNANANAIRQESAQLFAFAIPDNSLDAVLLLDLAPGHYTVVADDASGGQGVVILELYDADVAANGSTLINMSNRGFVGTGAQVMISGFVVSSDGPKTVLIRAVGPGIAGAPYNVPNTVVDPVIDLYRSENDGSDTLILTQDDWSDSPDAAAVAQSAAQVSAFALTVGSRDAAVVTTLQPGAYTVNVRGLNNATGTALVEVYTVE